jgi:hypothetical protein
MAVNVMSFGGQQNSNEVHLMQLQGVVQHDGRQPESGRRAGDQRRVRDRRHAPPAKRRRSAWRT